MNAIQWLEQRAPVFAELVPPERDAIMHFALLWSRFEAKALDENGNAKAIIDAATLWNKEKLLTAQSFTDELAYFRHRYCPDGQFSQRFQRLNFRKPDRRELVEKVLREGAAAPTEAAAAVLIIVYRLRNNYFHGVKWSDRLRNQFENFTHANNALMQAIDLHDRSSAAY